MTENVDGNAESDLPTEAELLALADIHGGGALVWLTYRCYGRYITLLGQTPIDQLWPEQPLKNTYYLWQECFLLVDGVGQWGDDYLPVGGFDLAPARALASDLARASDLASDLALASARALDLASASARALNLASARDRVLASKHCIIPAIALNEWRKALIADVGYLRSLKPKTKPSAEQQLWPNQSAMIEGYQHQWLSQLTNLGLEVLADDIQAFFQGRLPSAQLEKYRRKLSDLELTNARDLAKALTQGTIKYYGVRLLLVGPGGAGKTSLADLLSKKETALIKQSTLGVNHQQHQQLDLNQHQALIQGIDNPQLAQMQLYLWDFGGQAIFHSLHNAFMHENCVYVLVVDSRHEQAPDEWLHQIATLTNNKGQVIVVTNWHEGIETQQNRVGLIRKFPSLLNEQSFFDFSCLQVEGGGFRLFLNQLLRDCLASQREILRETQQAFEILQAQYQTQRFIERDDLAALLCAKLPDQTPSTVPDLLAKLAEFGRFVDVSSDTNEALCLQPEWVIDAAYQLIYAPQLRQNGGIIDLTTIKAINKTLKLDTDSITKLLTFMLQHQVCIQLTAVSGQGKVYFFPDAAPVDEPAALQSLIEQPNNLVMYYELAYIPIGVRAKMVSRMMALTEITINPAEVWRDGFMVSLTSDSTQRAQIIVEYHYRQQRIQLTLIKTSDDSEGKASGELLAIIDRELEQAIGRKVLNYLVLDARNEQSSDQQQSYSQTVIYNFYNGSNQYQGVSMGNKITTIGNVSGSLVNTGDKVNIEANMNSHNQQPQMNADQRALLLAVIKQAVIEVATNQFNSGHMMILTQAATALEQSSDQLPEVADPHTNGLLTEIWTVMKNIDAVTAMAEKSNKYLAPYVATALTYLGSLV